MTNETLPDSPEPSNTTSAPPQSENGSGETGDHSTLAHQVADLFLADPLSLTEEDLTFLAQYYQAKRLEFTIAEQKPKTLRVSRGPKLDKEASKARMNALFTRMIGEKKAATDTGVEENNDD